MIPAFHWPFGGAGFIYNFVAFAHVRSVFIFLQFSLFL